MKSIFLTSTLLLSQATVSTGQLPAGPSSIQLLKLNQPPCATLSARSVLQAKLAYHIADGEQSEFGFAVSIKFQGTVPRHTFSKGSDGSVLVVSRHDTLTLRYPVAATLSDSRLAHPVTCYFYLHRNLGRGRSTVIAKTDAIVFKECQ